MNIFRRTFHLRSFLVIGTNLRFLPLSSLLDNLYNKIGSLPQLTFFFSESSCLRLSLSYVYRNRIIFLTSGKTECIRLSDTSKLGVLRKWSSFLIAWMYKVFHICVCNNQCLTYFEYKAKCSPIFYLMRNEF